MVRKSLAVSEFVLENYGGYGSGTVVGMSGSYQKLLAVRRAG